MQDAITVVLDELVSRGEFIGSAHADNTTDAVTETAKNIRIFAGMMNTPDNASGPFYSKLVPEADLLDNKTTVVDQYGDKEDAVLINSTIEFYSVMQYMRASYTNETIAANTSVKSGEHITLNTNIKLACDIYLGGCEWIAVGTETNPYTGVLDGNGHTIYDLHSSVNAHVLYEVHDASNNLVQSVAQTCVSLFGYTSKESSKNACIQNLTIYNAYATDKNISAVAPLAHFGYRLDVFNINVRGNLYAYGDVLGLCRYTWESSFRNCNVYADLKCFDSEKTSGIMMSACVGFSNDTRFENIYFNGVIRSEDTDRDFRCGALVAYLSGSYITAYKNVTMGPDVEFYGYAASASPCFTGKSNADDTTELRNNVRITYNLGNYDYVPSQGHIGQYAYDIPGYILTGPSYTKLFGKYDAANIYCLDPSLTNVYPR